MKILPAINAKNFDDAKKQIEILLVKNIEDDIIIKKIKNVYNF